MTKSSPSQTKGDILVVDDTPDNLRLLSSLLTERGYKVRSVISGQMALDAVQAVPPDLVLLDIKMPELDGYEVCQQLKAQDLTRPIPVIFLSALDDVLDKTKAFTVGGVDYISKPFEVREVLLRVENHLAIRAAQEEVRCLNAELEERVQQRTQQLATTIEELKHEVARRQAAEAELLTYQNELEHRVQDRTAALYESEQRSQYLEEELQAATNFDEIVGASSTMTEVLTDVGRVAATDATVLIHGESGTGKELIARAIHANSPRRDRPLVKVNCAAFPASLVESELFGHEKGAFTGATATRMGRFELANGGTLFLDEISEIPLDIQVKLLRVLQERELERVGGTETLTVDVRIIAATNRDLIQDVKAGRFREDLYYRINVFPISLPRLQDRASDIPLLVQHFVAKHAAKQKKTITTIPALLMQTLSQYPWPGNIRELENVIERAVILTSGTDLALPPMTLPSPATPASLPSPPKVMHPPFAPLEEVERHYLQTVLEHYRWVINGPKGAAAIIGLHPNTLRNRLLKLGIERPR